MQNNLIDKKIVDQKLAACGISDMEDATIRDIVKVVNMVETESGEKFIRCLLYTSRQLPRSKANRLNKLNTKKAHHQPEHHHTPRMCGDITI